MTSDSWRGRIARLLPDRTYRALKYRRAHGRWPNMRSPRRYTEKVAWRVLFDRRDGLIWTCDKLGMKDEVARRSDIAIPRTLWVGADLRELAGVRLPDQWVLKPNNASGSRVMFGAGQVDAAEAVRLTTVTDGWLRGQEWVRLREWAYSFAKPVFLVEERVGRDDPPPMEVKAFMFDGRPRFLLVVLDRFSVKRRGFVTPDWEEIPVVGFLPRAEGVARPASLERILRAAADISADLDHLRVDFLVDDPAFWFNEVTAYSWSGLDPILPASLDEAWGDAWTLPVLGPEGRQG